MKRNFEHLNYKYLKLDQAKLDQEPNIYKDVIAMSVG